MALVQVAQIADWLGWEASRRTAEQDRLTRIAETASGLIERKCGRSFGSVTETRSFDVNYRTDEIHIGDIASASLVEVRRFVGGDYSPLAQADYELYAAEPGRPARWIRRTDRYPFPAGGNGALRITGTWGWAAVPPDIQQAVVMEASRLILRQQSPQGDMNEFQGGDYDMRSNYDPDILDIVDNYKVAVIA